MKLQFLTFLALLTGTFVSVALPSEARITCSDFTYQEDAQESYHYDHQYQLDGDRDGIACENLRSRSALRRSGRPDLVRGWHHTVTNVNMRSGPSIRSGVITNISYADFYVYSTHYQPDGHYWAWGKLSNGRQGWIRTDLLVN